MLRGNLEGYIPLSTYISLYPLEKTTTGKPKPQFIYVFKSWEHRNLKKIDSRVSWFLSSWQKSEPLGIFVKFGHGIAAGWLKVGGGALMVQQKPRSLLEMAWPEAVKWGLQKCPMENTFYPFASVSPRNFCCVTNSGLYWKADRNDLSLEVLGAQSSYGGWDLRDKQYLRCFQWSPTPGFLVLVYFPPPECEIDIATHFQQWESGRNVGKSLLGIGWKKKKISSYRLSLTLSVDHVDGTQLPCYELPHQEAWVWRNLGNSLANSLQTCESYQWPMNELVNGFLPVKTWDDNSLGQHLDYNIMRGSLKYWSKISVTK